MLIATRDFDVKALSTIMTEPEKVVSVVEASVPIYLRHHREIVMNQRFYIANMIRGAGSIPMNIKLPVCEALVKGITVTGTTEMYTTVADIMHEVDLELLKELFKEEHDDIRRDVQGGRGVYPTQGIQV